MSIENDSGMDWTPGEEGMEGKELPLPPKQEADTESFGEPQ